MSDKQLKCTARVTVRLEVNLTQPWSEEETLVNLFRQARASAKQTVEIMIQKDHPEMRVLGMSVKAVFVPEAVSD